MAPVAVAGEPVAAAEGEFADRREGGGDGEHTAGGDEEESDQPPWVWRQRRDGKTRFSRISTAVGTQSAGRLSRSRLMPQKDCRNITIPLSIPRRHSAAPHLQDPHKSKN